MPDTLSPDSITRPLTYRQRLEGIASNFERRERSVSRTYALRELQTDIDALWRTAHDEIHQLRLTNV